MTTKDKIKTLISVDRVLSQAIGHSESSPCSDKEILTNLLNTREKLEAVIFALCDELPDHIAAPEESFDDVPVFTPRVCPQCGDSHLLFRSKDSIYFCPGCSYEAREEADEIKVAGK